MTKVVLKDNDNLNTNINITDVGANRVSFKQNSSGFWYTNELTINCISIIDGIELAEKSIDKINKMLKDKNERSEK